MEDAGQWQRRPLVKSYAIVYLDALRVDTAGAGREKLPKECVCGAGGQFRGEERGWRNSVSHGLCIAKNEGANFWAPVLNGIRNRGTEDILTVRMDGLAGFPGAGGVSPNTDTAAHRTHGAQLRAVHFVQRFKEVCAGLKAIFRAPGEEAGRAGGPNTRSFTSHETRPGLTCTSFLSILKKSAVLFTPRTR
jgi:transposase-like protein